MKFNWGHAIAIVFILFATYILYFVYQSFNTNIDLVSEDYYAQEVAFQSRIDATANGDDFQDLITIAQGETGLMLNFPTAFEYDIEGGLVTFFRPSEQSLDRSFPLELDANKRMFFPRQLLSSGRYKLNISWKSGEQNFFLTKDIVI
ncbi:MAG: FixH family protein [Flavobacteriales bacterium]|nr:FixH family protein [Flavobacteriales bacterium]